MFRKIISMFLSVIVGCQLGELFRTGVADFGFVNPISLVWAALLSNPAQIYLIELLLSMFAFSACQKPLYTVIVPGLFATGLPYVSMMAWCTGGQSEYQAQGTSMITTAGFLLCLYLAYCFGAPKKKEEAKN